MVQVKQQLVSQNVINQRSYGRGNPVKSVTIHQTGNTNKGANAQAHANIQSRLNPRQASWHYSVDDAIAIQSFPDNVMCWHATDGRGPGNTTSLAVEICINSDGDYAKAIKNATDLVRTLLKRHSLTVKDIKQHRDWYNKNCPAQLRAGYKGITWNMFVDMVENPSKYKEKPTTPAPEPKPQPKPKEEDDMLEKAIVINSFADFPVAESVARNLKAPIYMRSTAEKQEVAKEVIVIGGNKNGLKGKKFTVLSGGDRFETAAKVAKYLK